MFSQPKRQNEPPQIEYLTRHANTVPSFVANRAGKLTSEQVRRLRSSELEISPNTQKRLRAENNRKWERATFQLLAFGLAAILLFAILNINLRRATDVLMLAAIFVIITIDNTRKSLLDEQTANDLLRKERVNALNSKWAPNNIGVAEGIPKTDQRVTIIIGEIRFRLDETYWREFCQRELENRLEPVCAYYLRDWQPAPLLSFQTVKVANSLSQDDERFEYAVGVGDDGEIVFASEQYDDALNKEVVEIPRSALS